MNPALDPLFNILRPERVTAVVDIGANPLESDGDPPYKSMLTKRLCTLVGFEPQADALVSLNARKSDLETYLPYAVGDGSKGILNVCRARGMSSLLTPDPQYLRCFPHFTEFGEVMQKIPVETRTLDSISEIKALDLLKIDVQGAELSVFQNGRSRLADTVVVQSEVSFVPLYKNQPVIGDIDLALRTLGFIPHMFAALNKRMILPLHYEDKPFAGMNQLLEADIVYIRDFSRPEAMSSEQLKHLALIAHHCYNSFDLAVKCMTELASKGSIQSDSVGRYMKVLTGNQ